MRLWRFCAIVALLLPAPAAAWWDYGHETIARIAERNVRPDTRAAIRRLLARSSALDTPTCPARTIVQASLWPDCIRALGHRFSYASPWHYQNVPICRPFDARSGCTDGNCISAQIQRNARLLADRSLPVRERVMALAFVVHLVGDLHQPLHVADRNDLGGNRQSVFYGIIPRNLHLAWDGDLAERGISTPPANAAGILSEFGAGDRAAMREGTPTDWARESWAVGRELAYGSLLADPCAAAGEDRPVISEATTQRLIPVIRRQVARGGLRLARMLDEALD